MAFQLNRKNMTLLAVIVVMNIAAVIIIYRGFFADEASVLVVSNEDVQANQQDIIKILPYGTSLDLDLVNSKVPKRAFYERGKRIVDVKPEEVGLDPNQLFEKKTATSTFYQFSQ